MKTGGVSLRDDPFTTGFDAEHPDYRMLTDDKRKLTNRYREICATVDGGNRRSLPSMLRPFSTAVLLWAIDDPLVRAAGLSDADDLRGLRNLAKARNRSMLAHGEESVSAKMSAELNDKALQVLRARLLEAAERERDAERSAERRAQVGGGGRSEKIRTYNYKENRVSDHRIGLTLYKLQQVLGGELDEVVEALMAAERARQLAVPAP